MKQLTAHQARLDNALAAGLVHLGARFLYTIDGTGKCYEGRLIERSPEGHVKLDESGTWQWPPEVHIEELLGAPASGPAVPPLPLPSAKPPVTQTTHTHTTKHKR